MTLIRAKHHASTIPPDWWDSAYEQRIRISATNTTSNDLNDSLVTYTPLVSFDTPSLRVIEHTVLGSVDRAFDWRYGPLATNDVNHLTVLPVSVAGGVVTFKSLGRWAAGETRYFNLYWSTLNHQSALSYGHLDAVAYPWTVALTAGTAGDSYVVTVNGTAYTYVMLGGDTPTLIAVALKNLINAGTVATATNSAGTLSVFSATPRDPAYTVAGWVVNTGSTTTGNLVVTQPAFFGLGRMGPDLFVFAAPTNTNNTLFGLGTSVSSATAAGGVLSHGRPGANTLLRMLRYSVNTDATAYFAVASTISTVTVNGPTLTITGTMSTTNTGSNPNKWTATYTATYRHKVIAGMKSDLTNAGNVQKYTDLMRMQIVWTNSATYAPTTAATGNTLSNHVILALADTTNTFGGNVTEDASQKIANFYALPGQAATSFAASADLHSIPVIGTVMGSSGNTHAIGVVVHSCVLTGFGTAAPQWFANANPFAFLQINGLASATAIPLGATVTVDFTLAEGLTINPSTAGDNLLPSELVPLLQNAHAAALGTPSLSTALLATEPYNASVLTRTMLLTSDRLFTGMGTKYALAAANLKSNSYAFAYNPHTGLFSDPDDNDGTLGEAFALAGLVLRYLRTGDVGVLDYIERQARYHIDLERDAVLWYGSWWVGSAPYWWSPLAQTINLEGGFLQPQTPAQVDPTASVYGGSLTQAQTTGLGQSGGAWRGLYNGATTYINKDWVYFADAGGTYAGVFYYAQWIGGSSGATPFPTNGSGVLQGSWTTKAPVQYTIAYAVNQPRASTSNDQLHGVCLGYHHYLWMLRNDPILTSATPPTWRVGDIVRGSNGDMYTVGVGATTVTYTQVSGDTDAYLLTQHIVAAINASPDLQAAGVVAAIAPTTAIAPSMAAFYLTGCTGLTVTNAGSTHTANIPVATLRQASIDLLRRMAEFQSAALAGNTAGQPKTLYASCGVPPLYNLVTGTTTYATSQNGITTHLGTTYSNYAANAQLVFGAYSGGSQNKAGTFGNWELAQQNNTPLTADSNGALADVFRSICTVSGPDGQSADQSAIIAYLLGVASDCLSLDMGRHAWHYGSTVTVYGVAALGSYPPGWNLRSTATGNNGLTQAGTPATTFGPYGSAGTNDAHYIDINSAGVRDNANGRGYERMAALCMLALFNPNAEVLVEVNSTASPNAAIVRQVVVTDLIDDMARTLNLYMIEPITHMVRFGAAGPLGAASGVFSPLNVHTTFGGYAMMSVELWFLVRQRMGGGNPQQTYYRFPGV